MLYMYISQTTVQVLPLLVFRAPFLSVGWSRPRLPADTKHNKNIIHFLCTTLHSTRNWTWENKVAFTFHQKVYTVICFIFVKKIPGNNFRTGQIQRKYSYTKIILHVVGTDWNCIVSVLLSLLRWLVAVKRRWSVLFEATTYIKLVWEAAIAEELVCTREATNAAHRYTTTVMNKETIIGHLPRKISKVCSMFLQRGGSMRWKLNTLYTVQCQGVGTIITEISVVK